MVNRIYAVPRKMVQNFISGPLCRSCTDQNLLISICDRPQDRLICSDLHKITLQSYGYHDCLELFFADTTVEHLVKYQNSGGDVTGQRFFGYDDARAIKRYIDEHKDRVFERLLIHCNAGQSRSGAVAAWAFYYLRKDGLCVWPEIEFWRLNPFITPNPQVVKILCEVSGITFDPLQFRASYEGF